MTPEDLREFHYCCQEKCSKIYQLLDSEITPRIIFVVISKLESKKGLNPSESILWFNESEIEQLASELLAGKQAEQGSSEDDNSNLENQKPSDLWHEAILHRISTIYSKETFLCSCGIKVCRDDQFIIPVVVIAKTQLVDHLCGAVEGYGNKPINLSLIGSIYKLFSAQMDACFGSFNSKAIANLDERDLLVGAGTDLIDTAMKLINPNDFSSSPNQSPKSSLYESCNKLSTLTYERAIGRGTVLFAKSTTIGLELPVKLIHPFNITEIRKTRKLLETTTKKTALLSDGNVIHGICESLNRGISTQEAIFEVTFLGHYKWVFSCSEVPIMHVEYGRPIIPEKSINKSHFSKIIRSVFDTMQSVEVEKMWKLVIEATNQHHGTMIVISEKAKSEAERLKMTAFASDAFDINENWIVSLSSIDGAVLIDENRKCYALGVILDGEATDNADAARGARFNSALRYYHTEKKKDTKVKLAIVIISEDGTVDIIPPLSGNKPTLPQIEKKTL